MNIYDYIYKKNRTVTIYISYAVHNRWQKYWVTKKHYKNGKNFFEIIEIVFNVSMIHVHSIMELHSIAHLRVF